MQPDFISNIKFELYYQNNLQIMSDQKTIIGKQYTENEEYFEDEEENKEIFFNVSMEDITGRKKR